MSDYSDSLCESKSICENSSINSETDPLLKSVLCFFGQLNSKGLKPCLMETLFFSSPLELFSKLKNISIENLKIKIKENLHILIEQKEELFFLKKFEDLKYAFVNNMDKTLFTGLLIYVLCFIFNFNCKLFQFHDRKSLVSCEIDLDGKETIRIAIIIFNQGFQFSVLTKIEK